MARDFFIFLDFLFDGSLLYSIPVPGLGFRHSGIVPSCNLLIINHLRARRAPKSLIFNDFRGFVFYR